MKKDAWFAVFAWGCVVFIIAIVCQPFWNSQPPDGHDLPLHFYRIATVNELWQQGVFFSRWVPDLVLGYGSPLFLFYPPGSAYLLTGIYWLTGANAPIAYNITAALLLAMATVGMFLLGRKLYGTEAGLVASAAYAFSPYLLYQVFQRGSLSNMMALGLFPWVLWGMRQVTRQPSRRWMAGTAVLLALVLSSHTTAGLLFVGMLGVIMVCMQTSSITQKVQPDWMLQFGYGAGTMVLGLALATAIWLPALVEFRFSRYEAAAHSVNFHENFAQDWLDWPFPAVANLYSAALPITPGLGQLFIGGIGWVVTGMSRFLAGMRGLGDDRKTKSPNPLIPSKLSSASLQNFAAYPRQPDFLPWGLGGLTAVFLFLTQPVSAFLWEHIPWLQQVQFPWRLLDVPVFCLALLCGWVVWQCNGRFRWLIMIVSLPIFFLNALPYLYPPHRSNLPPQPSLTDVTQAQQQYGIYGLTSWGEYTSATVVEWPVSPPFVGADQGATLEQKLITRDGLLAASGTPWQADLQFDLPVSTTLTFYIHYFPGWQARVDGESISVAADANGRLSLAIPAGSHYVQVDWGRTPIRWLADALSLFAALYIVGLVFTGNRRPVTLPVVQAQTHIPAALPLLLMALLVGKTAWIDRFNTPFVRHPAPDHIPSVAAPPAGDFGPIRLIGYELAPDGHLALYWYAQEDLTTSYHVIVNLVNARGVPVKTITNPYPGATPTTHWQAGRLTLDEYQLPINQEQRPIGYRVTVSLLNSQTGQMLPLLDSPEETAEFFLGTLKRPPLAVDSPPGQSVGAVFGEAIELVQATMPERVVQGEEVELILVWRAKTAVSANYTVFIHLLDLDDHLITTQDSQPLGGLYPTSYWSPGELITDSHPWQLEAPPGRYRVEIGLYHLDTGERLLITGLAQPFTDRVFVQNIEITPP